MSANSTNGEGNKDLKRPRGIESYFIASPKKRNETQPNVASEQASKGETYASINAAITKDNKTPEKSLKTGNKLEGVSEELQALIKLEIDTLHPSWFEALKDQLKSSYFAKLKQFLEAELNAKNTIFPPAQDIYSWSRLTPINEVKVVIIGQDPYHNVNQAHGLCFSVNKGNQKPPSLRNIFKELKKEYHDFTEPNHGFLGGWASQGVLLLNAALTVRAHQANSHADKGWEAFTDSIISHLNKIQSNLVFILWGAYAQKKGKTIDSKKHLILKGVHPSPLSASRGFFGCNHFLKANEYLESHGKAQINWLQTDVSGTSI